MTTPASEMELERSGIIEYHNPKELKPHPLSIKIYGNDDYQDLVESIRELGVLVPLYIKGKGIIVSGHRRQKAAIEAGLQTVPCILVKYNADIDEEQAIIEYNRYRMKNGQQLYNEGKALEQIERKKARQMQEATYPAKGQKGFQTNVPQNFGEHKDDHQRESATQIARAIGLGSGEQWRKLEYVGQKIPELLSEIKPGGITINQVYTRLRRTEVKEQVKQTQWPTGKYRVIYADPPWQYSNSQPDYQTVQDDHYPTMPLNDICRLPVGEISLDDAVLFLWATSPILEDAFKVINAWGFKYKAAFIWDKVKHNMGHYNSVRHEFLLIAVKGSCQPDTPKLFDSVQSIPRSDHSRKPEEFRDIIMTMYPYGPRVELFAREKIEGWESYGDQTAPAVSR